MDLSTLLDVYAVPYKQKKAVLGSLKKGTHGHNKKKWYRVNP